VSREWLIPSRGIFNKLIITPARSQPSGHEFWSRDTLEQNALFLFGGRTETDENKSALCWYFDESPVQQVRAISAESEFTKVNLSHLAPQSVIQTARAQVFYARRKLRVIAVKYKTRASFTFLTGMRAPPSAIESKITHTQDLSEHIPLLYGTVWVSAAFSCCEGETQRLLQKYLDLNSLNADRKESSITFLSTRKIKALCKREK